MPKLQLGKYGKYFLTIMKSIVESEGWQKGDQLELIRTRCPGQLVLERVR